MKRKLNKKNVIIMLLLILILINIINYKKEINYEQITLATDLDNNSEASIKCDYIEVNYSELFNMADIIALIEVKDNLTSNNSFMIFDNITNKTIVGYYAERKVEVKQYYKTNKNKVKNLTIIEPAVIYDNTYIHNEDYDKLLKGEEYIVYLSTDNSSNKLSVIAGSAGVTKVNGGQNFEKYSIEELYEDNH